MSGSLRLNGGTSGYSEITAPDVAGDQTFTLPAAGGEIVTAPTGGSVVGYQQGLWTPVLGYGSYASVTASWTRIGNLVELYVSANNFSDSTTDSAIQISGLPYNRTAADFDTQGPVRVRYINFANYVTCGVLSDNTIKFFSSETADTTSTITHVNIVTGSKTLAQIKFNISYLTDDTTWTPINGATIS